MAGTHEDDGYTGPASLTFADSQFEVEAQIGGEFQPIDGRYHWRGRLARHDGLTAVLGTARATGVLTTPQGSAPCELSDPDPWGRYRVTGVSTPPFTVGTQPPAEAGSATRAAPDAPRDELPGHVMVAIIGTGFGGLAAAIRLARSGRTDFVLLEKAASVGGTWRDNTYPGCACDVPSHLYSYSFAPNPAWTRSFSPQPEIWRYLEDLTTRYALRDKIRFGTEVRQARWDAAAARWQLITSRGELTCDVLVSATGPLSEPTVPAIPGLDGFPGEVFHSARWDPDASLAGRKVAVIGTGASAIQIVPAVQPLAAKLTLFQRTPAWVMPRRDRRITTPERWLYRHVPTTQKIARTALHASREMLVGGFTRHPGRLRAAQRIALKQLTKAVADPGLRAALTPDYVMGCKRILLSSDYYPALARPNAQVIASGLARVEGSTLIAADGSTAEADVLIFATGFHTTDMPIATRVYGADGLSLAEVWGDDMRALRGTTVAGFPNLCLIIGPNTGLGHNSMIHIIEAQASYVVDYLATLDRLGAAALDTRADAQRRWGEGIERRMSRTVWATGGCVSWYQNSAGRIPTLWPGSIREFREATSRVDPGEYQVIPPPGRVPDGARPHAQPATTATSAG
jgi:cation diffusion facilitator CzcD-associated flavoprotein CzcO